MMSDLTPIDPPPGIRCDFLVYAHTRLSDGSVFYVGKGTKDRPRSKKNRNPHWHHIVKKEGGFRVEIIRDSLPEDAAFELEIRKIAEIRSGGAKLCNMTNGGDGPSGYKHTEETRRRLSEANTGKPGSRRGHNNTPEHRAKTGAAHKGKKHSPEHIAKCAASRTGKPKSAECRRKISEILSGRKMTNEQKLKMSRPVLCLTNGVTYPSVNDAANALGVWRPNIAKVCRGKLHHTGGFKFTYPSKNTNQHDHAAL